MGKLRLAHNTEHAPRKMTIRDASIVPSNNKLIVHHNILTTYLMERLPCNAQRARWKAMGVSPTIEPTAARTTSKSSTGTQEALYTYAASRMAPRKHQTRCAKQGGGLGEKQQRETKPKDGSQSNRKPLTTQKRKQIYKDKIDYKKWLKHG